MHVLSELQNPLFDAPDRQRALQALQMSRMLKEDNTTRAWTVVKGMIDRVAGEQPVAQINRSQPASTYTSPTTSSMPRQAMGGELPPYIDRTQRYFQPNASAYGVSAPPAAPLVPQPQPFQPLEPLDPQFNWDDVNLNHIGGDLSQQNAELPEFDWVCLTIPTLCALLTLIGLLGRSGQLQRPGQRSLPYGYERLRAIRDMSRW